MMINSQSRGYALLLILFLAGCSSLEPPSDAALMPPLAAIVAGINADPGFIVSSEQATEPASNDGANVGLEWPDPRQAQRWAIANAPRVSHMIAELQSSQAEIWNASMLENPGFELSFLEPEADSGRWQLEAGLELGLADWLTRSVRLDRARAVHLVNQLDVLDDLTEYLHQIRHTWLNAVASRQQLAVHDGLYQTAFAMLEFAQQVQAAGNLNELDFLVYETEHARQQRALQAARLEADIAISELQSLLGLMPDQLPVLPDALPEVPAPDSQSLMDAEQAMNQAEQFQPRLRLLDEALNQQLASERLIRREYGLLDGAVQIGAERESNGERRLALGGSIELPLFDRGQAHLAEIAAATSSLTAEIEQARSETRHIISQALMSQQSAIELAQQVNNEDLPRHQRMLELALQEYNFMLRDTFSLLTLREQVFDAQLEYIDHTLAFWKAQSLLLSVTGTEALGITETGEFQ
ncbi:TolC family protein [Pseudohongiella sp. SYSU M77423]|uniref:TolC family protein n=1 Tax=Pseudohongiella sp. SYSU M77423 TaxID=3042312 RepID=UPI002480D675|nr:TolC family protein [Pseudohongiella sp. SYSU M77423]MDH7943133.1 TolC family protein [Pseudohongiella sp. SYSU M77423]